MLSPSLLLCMCASVGQLVKGSPNEADVLHCRCRFAARFPLVRLISVVMPVISKLADLRCGLWRVLTRVCYISGEPAFQKVAPIERLANFVNINVASMHFGFVCFAVA
jgi:hypothetical protein